MLRCGELGAVLYNDGFLLEGLQSGLARAKQGLVKLLKRLAFLGILLLSRRVLWPERDREMMLGLATAVTLSRGCLVTMDLVRLL